MLAHAEIESYLERTASQLHASIDAELRNERAGVPYLRALAMSALHNCVQSISANNGVKEADIRKMYEPLGITDEDFNAVSPTFLDRMSDFGKQRGDVAHRSVASAAYSLNVQREEAFIDEVVDYLSDFDKVVQRRRLLRVLTNS